VGAKSALLIYATGHPADLLRMPPPPDPGQTAALVAATHPGWNGASEGGGQLADCIYPPEGLVYAGSFPGIDVLCDREVMTDRPSGLHAHLRAPGAGRRMILHAMHSVSDWFAYSIWDDGVLLRSLSVAPGSGVLEDIGVPLPFEAPFWAGEHPVIPSPGWPGPPDYPLPFHPLELGEAALRELMGFVLEGRQEDPEAGEVELIEFAVTSANPVTEAQVDEFIRTRKRTSYRIGPGAHTGLARLAR
jgi:hypothetical protein